MFDLEDTVTIPKALYESLLESSDELECLYVVGVNNWEGYKEAMKLKEGEGDE